MTLDPGGDFGTEGPVARVWQPLAGTGQGRRKIRPADRDRLQDLERRNPGGGDHPKIEPGVSG